MSIIEQETSSLSAVISNKKSLFIHCVNSSIIIRNRPAQSLGWTVMNETINDHDGLGPKPKLYRRLYLAE